MKLQLIGQQKHVAMLAIITSSDPKIKCNGIIVLEAAAMLHDTDAEFAIIDSAHEAKSRRKYAVPVPKTDDNGSGTKKV